MVIIYENAQLEVMLKKISVLTLYIIKHISLYQEEPDIF